MIRRASRRASRRAIPAVLAALLLLASGALRPAAAGETRLDLAGSTLRFSEFPHPIEDVTGAVLLSAGIVSLDPLLFRVLHSRFTARGFFVPGKRLYDIRLFCPGVAPEDLTALVPDLPLFRAAAPVALDVRFRRDDTGETRSFDVATSRFRVDGSGVSARFGEVEGRNLEAVGWIRGKRRHLEKLAFDLFGGAFSFRGDLETFRAALRDARLETALAAHPSLDGKLRGRITVSVRRKGRAVSGRFMALDGEARELPFLASLSRALRVDRLTTLAFREVSASFVRSGETMQVRDLVVKSELADLAAHVTVTGRAGALSGGGRLVVRLRVVAESRRLKGWKILKDVMKRNSLTLKVKVRGTLDHPDLDISL